MKYNIERKTPGTKNWKVVAENHNAESVTYYLGDLENNTSFASDLELTRDPDDQVHIVGATFKDADGEKYHFRRVEVA